MNSLLSLYGRRFQFLSVKGIRIVSRIVRQGHAKHAGSLPYLGYSIWNLGLVHPNTRENNNLRICFSPRDERIHSSPGA